MSRLRRHRPDQVAATSKAKGAIVQWSGRLILDQETGVRLSVASRWYGREDQAAACKAAHVGSNPATTSRRVGIVKSILLFGLLILIMA